CTDPAAEVTGTTGWKMMRWLAGVGGVLLVLGLSTGCNRQCFLTKEAWEQSTQSALLPPDLERPGSLPHDPVTPPVPTPPRLTDPDRPPRYLRLQEAIAIALENGTASGRTGAGQGVYDTNMVSLNAGGGGSSTQTFTGQSDNVCVLALQPALSGSGMEA